MRDKLVALIAIFVLIILLVTVGSMFYYASNVQTWETANVYAGYLVYEILIFCGFIFGVNVGKYVC